MGTWQFRLALGLMACAGWVASWPSTGAAEEKPPVKAEGTAKTEGADTAKADEAAVAKIEKQIAGIEDRMKSLQQEEFPVSMAAVNAQKVADGADIEKYRQELEKGSKKKEHLEFRAAMESVAGQWRAFADKYERVVNMTKTLERDRDKAPPALQTKIDDLVKRANDKYRSLLDKVISSYEKCADYKNALQIYLAIYQSTPEAKRDRRMKKELAGLYKNAGDTKSSLALYKSMLDAVPEKDRFKDRGFVEEVAVAFKDGKDFRTAYQLYKGLWESIPEKNRGKEKFAKDYGDVCVTAGDARGALLVYKAAWDAGDKKDWGLGEKLGDLCDKLGDAKTALAVLQVAYDGMSDGDKKAGDKGGKLNTKIQNLKSKLGIHPAADAGNKKAGK
jgi:tetratricopeptide (TPR) repeat protein